MLIWVIITNKKVDKCVKSNKSMHSSRFSFATDVARGMSYLHQHRICHGRLRSLNCVLDDRWVCKITGNMNVFRQKCCIYKACLIRIYPNTLNVKGTVSSFWPFNKKVTKDMSTMGSWEFLSSFLNNHHCR